MSQTEVIINAAKDLVKRLEGKVNEEEIKELIIKTWKQLKKTIASEGSLRRALTTVRKMVEQSFPTSTEPKPGYYYTESGKAKQSRYEHLSLWYLTSNESRWDVVGDEARAEYWGNLPELPKTKTKELVEESKNKSNIQATEPQSEIETKELVEESKNKSNIQATEPQSEIETKELVEESKNKSNTQSTQSQPKTKSTEPRKPQIEPQPMTIQQLQIDEETKNLIVNAANLTGVDFSTFVTEACKYYAKTIVGKAKQIDEELTAIPTKELLENSKYSTHPGRPEELVRRAIQAIKIHNGNATEKNQKWFITQSLLMQLTGSRADKIKPLISEGGRFSQEVNDINASLIYDYDLDDKGIHLFNRKGGGRKPENEINLCELVPDGIG